MAIYRWLTYSEIVVLRFAHRMLTQRHCVYHDHFLPTQAATAQLVVSLVRSCRNDLTPYSGSPDVGRFYDCNVLTCVFIGKLLTALTNGLLDRSVGVRKAYAQAIGHLVKVRTRNA